MYSMSHHYPPVNGGGGGLGEHVEGSGTINPAALDAPGKFLPLTTHRPSARSASALAFMRFVLRPRTISCFVTSVASSCQVLTSADNRGI